ncbi:MULTISPECIES: hypothetical protein [Fischerella]|uniref:hypothetical protein n=1 Tax=Fischerella TaxID=1190 RepID=UPI0012FB6D35|nr:MULTISPECIES: hypothetical protein [Fischerella]MBD2429728.1 hypothetical protein [Fischerella sp. FACHB-380]
MLGKSNTDGHSWDTDKSSVCIGVYRCSPSQKNIGRVRNLQPQKFPENRTQMDNYENK